jgi:hypothetical protein
LALLAAQATGSRYDLGRLGHEIGQLDEGEPAADGGTRGTLLPREESNGTEEASRTEGSR